ncbi:ABC transporter substrate-binding protein [Rhodococcus sp. IEGM 1409]|uniref:ABC transporter substrate-binding protein n=1 Tax=Rhodococcus sp. IEGM 1409 TaxID=3047082 RepID=UPI0024B819A3|nr:ABC transporter substrate-binding protein [Rhodococcus sp. IEGM 1409]MDI9901671.1 ABC transporter substrate-binding protein [Rhodococcus sp. IEGM 1409]
MRFRSLSLLALSLSSTLLLLACGSEGGGQSSQGTVTTDGTLTISAPSDPGNLFPSKTLNAATRQLAVFGYESLVAFGDDGKLAPWLAESWVSSPTEVIFKLRDGVTCSDGSTLTAQTVADNYMWITDPANSSAIRGVFVPPDLTATADGAANTVTLKTAMPNPFLTEMVGQVLIVCSSGLSNPDEYSNAFDGTGLYTLTDARPGESYTLTRRSDYTWGPGGTTSDTPGLPMTVTVNVITNNITRANLLLSGETNFATVTMPDSERLEAAGMSGISASMLSAQLFFNHDDAHVTADPAVRMALVRATNTDEIAEILTGGNGSPAQSFQSGQPTTCALKDLHSSVPSFDEQEASRILDAAGWVMESDGVRSKRGKKLTVNILHLQGSERTAAFEYLASQWKNLGVHVTIQAADSSVIQSILLSGNSGNWDVADLAIGGVSFPSMMVSFFSGAGPQNFAKIKNPDFDLNVAAAMNTLGLEGCPQWQEAERAIVANADVLPIGWSSTVAYTDGFTARQAIPIEPWSIRKNK